MEYLVLGPTTKQQIKELLNDFIYAPVLKDQQRTLQAIAYKNTLQLKGVHNSFTYKGIFYTFDPSPPPPHFRRYRLSEELEPEMKKHLAEVKIIAKDEQAYVMGFITQMLNQSTEMEDYKRLLPDCLHPPLNLLTIVGPTNRKIFQISDEDVEILIQQNINAIGLVKQRLTMNLLI